MQKSAKTFFFSADEKTEEGDFRIGNRVGRRLQGGRMKLST